MLERLRKIASATLDLVFPPRCVACSATGISSPIFCELCWLSVLPVIQACPTCALPGSGSLCPSCERASPPFSSAQAPYLYGGALAVALRRFKYDGEAHAARALGGLLRLRLPRPEGDPLLVPVPLHRRRLHRRGYNQSALLARAASRGTGLKVDVSALRRKRDTPSQAGLPRKDRLANLRGAFLAARGRVAGRRIVLIDDILTTGATATACTEALLEAGAREVSILTLARVSTIGP